MLLVPPKAGAAPGSTPQLEPAPVPVLALLVQPNNCRPKPKPAPVPAPLVLPIIAVAVAGAPKLKLAALVVAEGTVLEMGALTVPLAAGGCTLEPGLLCWLPGNGLLLAASVDALPPKLAGCATGAGLSSSESVSRVAISQHVQCTRAPFFVSSTALQVAPDTPSAA